VLLARCGNGSGRRDDGRLNVGSDLERAGVKLSPNLTRLALHESAASVPSPETAVSPLRPDVSGNYIRFPEHRTVRQLERVGQTRKKILEETDRVHSELVAGVDDCATKHARLPNRRVRTQKPVLTENAINAQGGSHASLGWHPPPLEENNVSPITVGSLFSWGLLICVSVPKTVLAERRCETLRVNELSDARGGRSHMVVASHKSIKLLTGQQSATKNASTKN